MPKKLNRITIDPNVCMGQATIRGMRITVSFILKLLGSGMDIQEILVDYPELQKEDILQAIQYAAWLSGEYTRPLVSTK
jgi:uncharacterized protein (DUF433 family)